MPTSSALPTQFGAILLLLTFLCAAAKFDIALRRIPNAVSYTLVLFGLVFALARDYGVDFGPISSSSLDAILGAFICFAGMFIIYAYTNSGAGDVKLAAGIGAFLGVKGGLLTICYAYITAACFVGCLMIWLFGFGFAARSVMRFSQIWPATERPEIEAKAKRIMSKGLPLAPFFLIGTILTLFDLLRFFPAN